MFESQRDGEASGAGRAVLSSSEKVARHGPGRWQALLSCSC